MNLRLLCWRVFCQVDISVGRIWQCAPPSKPESCDVIQGSQLCGRGTRNVLRCGLKRALSQTASSFCFIAQVVDAPRFAWRGVLLDVGRHFFPVPFILKILDVCAFYKITRFHWHLTEDQARLALRGGTVVWGLVTKILIVAMGAQGIVAPAEARSLSAE